MELYNPMDSATTITKNANVTANDTNPVSLGMPALGQAPTNGLIPKKSGWILNEARGINDGRQIVGMGQNPSLILLCQLNLGSQDS